MKRVLFATGNQHKFLMASHMCEHHDIQLVQQNIDVPEIQSEDPAQIAADKAAKAYAAVGKPVVITDDSWSFAGLKGFPGPYMHSINKWFTPNDFLHLTQSLRNRKITLTQYLVYDDGKSQKVFTRRSLGKLLAEPRGTSQYASHTIMALDSDDGLSIAEAFDRITDLSTRDPAQIWKDFATWFCAK